MDFTPVNQIRQAIGSLNPREVQLTAERPVRIGLAATSRSAMLEIVDFLVPPGTSPDRRRELVDKLHRIGDPAAPGSFDIEIYEEGLARSADDFTWFREDPDRTVREILERHEGLGLALARRYRPFRDVVTRRIVQSVARENAVFALLTGLPNVVPSLISLPWAVGEFASDTAVLTVNQMRMAFLLAAASDRTVGYSEQKTEIASIFTGAFGWRALARELVGKIPLGGGLIPKGAIAYAGTYVVGLSLERLYRLGYSYTRAERREAYRIALDRGRAIVEAFSSRNRFEARSS